MGACVSEFFSESKAAWQLFVQVNPTPFFVKSVRGFVLWLYFGINFLQKLQNPRKDWIPFIVVGTFYFIIARIFSGFTAIPSVLMINPRYFVRVMQNLYLSISTCNLHSYRQISTRFTQILYSFLVLKKIRILFKYVLQKLFKYFISL